MSHLVILFVALIVDRCFGDPDWLWRRAMHPVVVFGKLVGYCDKQLNRPEYSDANREKLGLLAIAGLLLLAIVVGRWMGTVFGVTGPVGAVIEIAFVAVLLAQKSLADHVLAVADGLRQGGLEGGRATVSMIVGRDPKTLDEAGVGRAAIESLAENASDGVVAPVFWYALFGLPGLFAYKMLNTADSMIGHRTERHRAFGRASAQLDDIANWLPARLTAMLIAFASYTMAGRQAAEIVWHAACRDARLHRSPNAGWPESAMAAALGIALGGPRIYSGDVADEPFLNGEGRREATVADIDAAIGAFWRAMTVMTVAVGLLALVVRW
ncbi:adenosylcobinamide-phosphate synthase CbiB [Oricola sp.]|uniref:adenosylcobinamide-phosphate synthase CbiB n=1 Tax=Oricola sp. TaxID=1979950 RepID=UPI003BA8461D